MEWCQILAIFATVFLTILVSYGLGEHLATLLADSPQNIVKNELYQWIFTTFATIAISTGKLAIICLILQIEGSAVRGTRRWVLWIFAGSNVVVNVIVLPIIWVQCTPTAKLWDESIPGSCTGRARNQMYGYFQGSKPTRISAPRQVILTLCFLGFGAFLDLAMAIYPIFIFWNPKMQLHVKVGLMTLFGFGVV
jgi:hypothetical protein